MVWVAVVSFIVGIATGAGTLAVVLLWFDKRGRV